MHKECTTFNSFYNYCSAFILLHAESNRYLPRIKRYREQKKLNEFLVVWSFSEKWTKTSGCIKPFRNNIDNKGTWNLCITQTCISNFILFHRFLVRKRTKKAKGNSNYITLCTENRTRSSGSKPQEDNSGLHRKVHNVRCGSALRAFRVPTPSSCLDQAQ